MSAPTVSGGAKTRGRPFAKGADPRRGEGARAKKQGRISSWMEEFGNMTGAELAKLCRAYAKELVKAGDELTLKQVLAIRLLMSAINDPDGAAAGRVLDRLDGGVVRVNAQIDWREEAKLQGYDPDELVRQFAAAMVRGHVGGSAEANPDANDPAALAVVTDRPPGAAAAGG